MAKLQTGFYIDEEVHTAILKKAEKTTRSKNYIVNEILKKELLK
jgi:predicted HicB family RNase H-like nuclease